MSCCGSRRASYRPGPISSTPSGNATYRPAAIAIFEYTGHAQLTVRGPVTGVMYRFDHHGQRAQVHGADVASLRAIPHLRALR